MDKKYDQKASYYSASDVVELYDVRRFCRGGGKFVAQLESNCLTYLLDQIVLPKVSLALDCPTGTGRFIPILKKYCSTVVAADISKAMLEQSSRYNADEYLNQSADQLSLKENSIDVWLMSRFCFHFKDPQRFLSEASRVLKPGGFLIADFYNWTPRSWIPGKQLWLGGRTYQHRKNEVSNFARNNGFSIIEVVPIFALAPYIYGFLPSFLTAFIERLSNMLPSILKTKSYYLFVKD